jgi:hypothetical protein
MDWQPPGSGSASRATRMAAIKADDSEVFERVVCAMRPE